MTTTVVSTYATSIVMYRQAGNTTSHRMELHLWAARSVDEARGIAVAAAMTKYPDFMVFLQAVVLVPDEQEIAI